MSRTGVQFDPEWDYLFWLDQILAVWSVQWSGGGFTPAVLVQIKLKSLIVWTKRGRCESALSAVVIKSDAPEKKNWKAKPCIEKNNSHSGMFTRLPHVKKANTAASFGVKMAIPGFLLVIKSLKSNYLILDFKIHWHHQLLLCVTKWLALL